MENRVSSRVQRVTGLRGSGLQVFVVRPKIHWNHRKSRRTLPSKDRVTRVLLDSSGYTRVTGFSPGSGGYSSLRVSSGGGLAENHVAGNDSWRIGLHQSLGISLSISSLSRSHSLLSTLSPTLGISLPVSLLSQSLRLSLYVSLCSCEKKEGRRNKEERRRR
jgi:hypothetical protein